MPFPPRFGIVSSAVKAVSALPASGFYFYRSVRKNIFESTRFSIFYPLLADNFLSRRTAAMEAGNTIPVLKIKLEVIFLFNSILPNFRLSKVCFPLIFPFPYQIQNSEAISPINNPHHPPSTNCHLLPPNCCRYFPYRWALFLAAGVSFSSGSAACLSAAPKGNSKGTKLCFSWETTPFGMERYGLPLLFCFPLQSKQQHCEEQGQQEKNII